MFHRISEGFYEFGTKKLQLQIKNNQIMVRVGGGWQDIDEFLDY